MAEVCAICAGSGWKIVERGGLSGAERCVCQAVARVDAIREAADIPPLYRFANLKSFNVADNDRQALNAVLLQVTQYVKDFPARARSGLMFSGPAGVGKTHLAVGVLKALIGRGFEGKFVDYQNLLERIKVSYSDETTSGNPELYWEVLAVPVLLIDDLGAMRASEWVQDTVCQLLTHRCNANLPTIITTNLPDDREGELGFDSGGRAVRPKKTLREVLGPRSRSRLFEMCRMIQMPDVADYRVASSGRRGNL